VIYQKDALLAATFVPGGSNNEVFVVGGDGQLLYWKGERSLSPKGSVFEKPTPDNPQQIVQPGFASFSPDGRWLLIIPPTLASAADGASAVQGSPSPGALPARASAGHELCVQGRFATVLVYLPAFTNCDLPIDAFTLNRHQSLQCPTQ
jgi:hypothetical protein